MTDKTETLPAKASSAVALLVERTPATMFSDAKVAEGMFAEIEEEVKQALEALDLTTAKGRGSIASLAYKVAQTKQAVDDAGKQLGEDARKALEKINAERRVFKEKFQTLQDTARAPLTAWEEADAKRQERVKAALDDLRKSAVVAMGETAAAVRQRYQRIAAMALDEAEYLTDHKLALELQRHAMGALEAGYAGLVQAEKDAAELRRLQKAEEDRKLAEEAEAKAKAEAEAKAEADKLAAAEAEAKAENAAWDSMVEEAERENARLDADWRQLWAAAEAENAGRDAEARRKAKIAEDQAREEQARRADEAHRTKVTAEAAEAVMAAGGIGKVKAEAIVAAMVAGKVPHVTVEF